MIRSLFTKLNFVRTAFAVGVGIPFLIASSAFAQGPTPTPGGPVTGQAPDTDVAANANPGAPNAGGAEAERIIVTGSYIPTAETESALPVTVYTAEVITKQGAQTPAEGLRQLPSFVGNTLTENDSNGGDGTAFINLRALGTGNTLTLINGRRTFALGFQDINLLGLGSLSRTEILKDGASSIYGSDAVAGVVNFILLDGPNEAPYQGAELFALYGNTTDTDAHVRQFYVRGGATGLDGKFSVAASGEYFSRANLFARDREIARTGDVSNDALGLGLGGGNTNSSLFPGRVSTFTDGPLILTDQTTNAPTPASYRPFDVIPGTDPGRFNFRNFSPTIPAQERFNYYVTANYKVFGDAMQIYGDILYSHLTQDNGLAPSPFQVNGNTGSQAFPNDFSGSPTTGDLPLYQNSPFNPFGDNLASVSYRLVQELGNRRSFFEKDAWRYVAAVKGDFNFTDNAFISHFGYDSGMVYERFNEVEADSGDATASNVDLAVQAATFDPFIGLNAPPVGVAPTYINGVPTGLTAPYNNIAAIAGGIEFQNQFLGRAFLVDAKFNAHLFPNLYNGGLDIAGGYEHRQIRTENIADNVQAQGDQLGFNAGSNLKNTQEVDSLFAELSIPFVTSTMNIPGVRSFELSLAYRYEKFHERDDLNKGFTSSFDNSNPDEDFGGTPRLALRYQPIADVTLRATASQSFQAPLPGQLFQPVIQDFPQIFDPIRGVTDQPPNGVFEGGNVNLRPERTDSYTAGLVYSPHFVPGLTLTADYYQLFTTNLIVDAASFAQFLVTSNVIDPDGAGAGNPNFGVGGPGLGLTRDANGVLQSVDSALGNAGRRNVQGIDLTAIYQFPTQNFGTFTVSGGLNHFFTYKIEAIPGQGFTNFLGNYNNGTLPLAPGAIPFNKAFLRGEWEWKGFDFVATGNYIGDYEDDPFFIKERNGVFQDFVPDDPGTTANPNFILHRRVSDYITLDMQLSYTFPKPAPVEMAPAPGYSKDAKDGKAMAQASTVSTAAPSSNIFQRLLWDTRLTVGVNNAFDRNPPTVLGAFNDNYDTSLYNIRNRYYYVSLTKKF